jgi:hypothetical protein
MTAMLVQSQKAEIFQVGKRHIKNHKMIDNRGNAKTHCPFIFRHTGFQSISSLPRQLPFPNISALSIDAHA